MTIDIADQIEVMKAALAGKQIQHRKRTGLNGTQWSIPTYFAVNYQFDFKTFEYRIYEPPKKKVKMYAWVDKNTGAVLFAEELVLSKINMMTHHRAPWLDGEIEV